MVTDNYDTLYGIARSEALKILGGYSGEDYSQWAEDIAQDTMMALVCLPTLDETRIHGLCKRIAQNKAATFKTTESRRREIEHTHRKEINRSLDGSREYLSASPDEIMAYEEMRDRLDELSPLLYDTVRAHYIDGKTVTEIAEAEGVDEARIYTRLHRARAITKGETTHE